MLHGWMLILLKMRYYSLPLVDTCSQYVTVFSIYLPSLSFLLFQAVDPSGEGSATWVLFLHSTLFSTSYKLSRKFSKLYLKASIRLFLCLLLLCCPRMYASRICLTQSSFSPVFICIQF